MFIFTVWAGAASIYQCVDDKSGITNRATNLNVDLKPFNKGDYGILVGPFAGGSDKMRERGRDFQHTVAATLRAKFSELNLKEAKINELPAQKYPSFDSHDAARAAGIKLNAELVIWGDITLKGVIPSITIVKGKSYSSQIAKCCRDITIFKNMYSDHFLNSVVDLKLPMITKEPVTITLYAVGLSYFDKGEYRKSLFFLKEALPRNPLTYIDDSAYLDISQVLTAIGLNYLVLKEYEDAKSALLRAFNMAPYNAMAGLLLATCYYSLGEEETAIRTVIQVQLLKAIMENPMLFTCLEDLKRKDYNAVITKITGMMARGMKEDIGVAHYIRGKAFFGKKKYQEAINDFESTIKLYPDQPQSYQLRAISYYSIQKFREAISDLSKFISLTDRPVSEVYRYRGCAYKNIGNNKNALMDLNKALEIDPENFQALLFKGIILTETKREQEALNTFETAAKVNPKNPIVHLSLGFLYEHFGKIQEAISSYKKVEQGDPNWPLPKEYTEFSKKRAKYLSTHQKPTTISFPKFIDGDSHQEVSRGKP